MLDDGAAGTTLEATERRMRYDDYDSGDFPCTLQSIDRWMVWCGLQLAAVGVGVDTLVGPGGMDSMPCLYQCGNARC